MMLKNLIVIFLLASLSGLFFRMIAIAQDASERRSSRSENPTQPGDAHSKWGGFLPPGSRMGAVQVISAAAAPVDCQQTFDR